MKLASRADSDRYVLGCNNNGEDIYYTEFDLNFEVQGDSVALRTSAMNTIETPEVPNSVIKISLNPTDTTSTDLNAPFDLTFRCQLQGSKVSEAVTIKLN